MTATVALCKALWLRSLLSEVSRSELKLVTFYINNKSVIALMKSPVFHGCSKHIDTRFHFIRECVLKRKILVEFICTRSTCRYSNYRRSGSSYQIVNQVLYFN